MNVKTACTVEYLLESSDGSVVTADSVLERAFTIVRAEYHIPRFGKIVKGDLIEATHAALDYLRKKEEWES